MTDDLLALAWRQESMKDDYWYGTTRSRFSAQVGKSTNMGRYMWMIFHEDFCCAIHGEEAVSAKEARLQAQEWLRSNAKPTLGMMSDI